MGTIDYPHQDHRKKTIEELRSHKVGVLLQIIDELEDMNLSVREIENVLRTCGLNDECAMRFGASITVEKEKGHDPGNRLMHP